MPDRVFISRTEAADGFHQVDLGLDMIRSYLEPGRPFSLQPSHVRGLQRAAVEQLDRSAGEYRRGQVLIEKADHQPPPPHLVENLVVEMCEYVNNNLHERTALHLAAYIMWRHNWIHPFSDGNGRTSRMLSYVVLCVKLGYELPGSPTIFEQIEADRGGYFDALQAADRAALRGEIDVSEMETLLKNMLARQLLSVIEAGAGQAQ